MTPISLVKTAHTLVKSHLRAGAIAVDATAGNGFDTLFLAGQVGITGEVYSFDIQQAALHSTRFKLQQMNLADCVTLIHGDHAVMADSVPERRHGYVDAIMFNLGYLPGGDKTLITAPETTLQALISGCRILSGAGIITIIAYPGHEGGAIETALVSDWCEQLNQAQFKVSIYPASKINKHAPVLFAITKIN